MKGLTKKAVVHIGALIKGILFTGFSIQILLGAGWMCFHFLYRQDFAEADSAFYLWIFRLLGENCQIMYLVQLLFAFYAGYRFLALLCGRDSGIYPKYERLYVVWGSLALLTFPFAMQCHLAVQPFSFMGSLFLLMLSFLVEIMIRPGHFSKGKKGWRKKVGFLAAAVLYAGFVTVLSGVADRCEGEPERSLASAMARRMAWPDLWNDSEFWPEELREIAGDVAFQASMSADNMELLFAAVEERAGAELAREYYRQMAEIGWRQHSTFIIHRIAWDILGYTITPLVFPKQMEGMLFDSYTGSNYEVMWRHMPVYTNHYVKYGCWWFGCFLILAAVLTILHIFTENFHGTGPGITHESCGASALPGKRKVLAVGICILATGILVAVLVMRGAGRMDYRYTIAVNGLWMLWALGQGYGRCGIWTKAGGKCPEQICETEDDGQSKV